MNRYSYQQEWVRTAHNRYITGHSGGNGWLSLGVWLWGRVSLVDLKDEHAAITRLADNNGEIISGRGKSEGWMCRRRTAWHMTWPEHWVEGQLSWEKAGEGRQDLLLCNSSEFAFSPEWDEKPWEHVEQRRYKPVHSACSGGVNWRGWGGEQGGLFGGYCIHPGDTV
jgi:hypothetical protein